MAVYTLESNKGDRMESETLRENAATLPYYGITLFSLIARSGSNSQLFCPGSL